MAEWDPWQEKELWITYIGRLLGDVWGYQVNNAAMPSSVILRGVRRSPYQRQDPCPRVYQYLSHFRDLELNRSASAVSMMGCDNSDYSYVTRLPGPGVTELLEEPVEEESEGEVGDSASYKQGGALTLNCRVNWSAGGW